MSNVSVNLAGVQLKNPVMTASGTFGSGQEYSEFVDLNKLGMFRGRETLHPALLRQQGEC